MSFNRSIYDRCAYNKRLEDNASVLTYNLDKNKFYNENQCRINFGIVGGNEVSLDKCNLVDVESELRNQTRPLSRCPEKKYLPKCDKTCGARTGLPCGGCSNTPKTNLPECSMINYQPRVNSIGYSLKYPKCKSNSCGLKSQAHPNKKIQIPRSTGYLPF